MAARSGRRHGTCALWISAGHHGDRPRRDLVVLLPEPRPRTPETMNESNHLDADHLANGLAHSARELATHAEELMHSTAAITGEGVAALRGKLGESLRNAREQIGNVQNEATRRGREAAQATDHWVHDKPWQAIAIATLFGLAVGFMSRSSRR